MCQAGNKDQAEKNCSAIKAQQDLANFESESQDYTVPKFTREEGVPDDPSQAEPKPTDSEPHPYVYLTLVSPDSFKKTPLRNKTTSPCPFPGFYGLLNCIKCGRCAGNGDCHLLTGVCNGGCQLGFFGSKCNMTCSATCGGDGSCSQLTAFCENGCQSGFTGTQYVVHVWEPIAATSLVVTIACIVILVLLYRRNKDRAEKNCSAIKAQRDLANFESESQDYTVPKFTRQEGVPDDQSQTEPKPTDSEPHPYIYEKQQNEIVLRTQFGAYSGRNKDRAGKNCSAIKAQWDLANFEPESQDYTVPKFTREEGVPDDQSQTEPKPTDSEPHPYIYVISS
uniref:Scavenger receptor class F member 2 n=1 Tax=Magallana gigas TaxID=29159 RepID=K1RFU2_MAGGI